MSEIVGSIRTAHLPATPDQTSPGGVAEIRKMLDFPAGELTHVRVPPRKVALPSRVHPSSEWFFVVSGRGQLWEGGSDRVVDLVPDRTVRVAPATPFQYRTYPDSELEIVLAVMPKWKPSFHGVLGSGSDGVGHWPATTKPEHIDPRGDLEPPDHLGIQIFDPDSNDERRHFFAPGGMGTWRLGDEDAGAMALCVLPPDSVFATDSQADAEEIWYVLGGAGHAIRQLDARQPVRTVLTPGTCIDVSREVGSQFHAGPDGLRMLVLTMPLLGSGAL